MSKLMSLPLLSFIAMLLSLLSTQVKADQFSNANDFSQRTLEGIKTVAVEVSDLNSHFKPYGLDKRNLTIETEEQLRAAGLTVISKEQLLLDESGSLIKLQVSDIKSDLGIISYSANIDIREKIPLPRRENSFISATIWSNGAHGIIRHHEVNRLREVIKTLVDSFISEHGNQNSS